MVHTRSGRLGDYRAVLNGKGEIAIGARARAERRKRIIIGAVGLCLIGGAVGAHLLLRPRERITTGRSVAVMVQCMDPQCGYQGTVEVSLRGARFPVKCPRCGQQSCQKLWECRDCGHRFVPLGGAAEVQCRECGSRRVGTAVETKGGDAPQ